MSQHLHIATAMNLYSEQEAEGAFEKINHIHRYLMSLTYFFKASLIDFYLFFSLTQAE